ncbi:MAG: T9SS type A sorting domain-containing protein [Weeksellaceae bacterium]
MKNFTIAFLICFFLAPHLIKAQFENIGSNEFGRIFGVNYDRTIENKLYAHTLVNHILTSDDNGQTWSVFYAIPDGSFTSLQNNLKTFQDNKLTYYIRSGVPQTGRSVFMLNTETREIEQQYTPPMPDPNADDNWVSSYSIFESDPNFAMIAVGYSIGMNNYEKVFYTTDAGDSWSQIYYTVPNLNIFTGEVAIDPINPEKLFITRGNGNTDTDGGLLISEDGGQNWTEKIAGIVLQPITFHPDNPDEIWVGTGISFGAYPENLYKSTDGGENWEIVNISWTDYLLDNINAIQFNPSDPANILVLEDNEVAISNDGGENWEVHVYEDASDNPDFYYYGLDASFNPFNENEVFISANYYPMFSTDRGATMERVKTPYFISDGNIHYYDHGDEAHLYYGVQFGFVHQNVLTGEENAYNILPINYVTNNSGTVVIPIENQPGRVFTYYGGFIGFNLYVSDDHGATQNSIYNNFSNSLNDLEAVPGETDKIWASLSFFDENPEILNLDFSDMYNVQVNPLNLPNSPGIVKDLLFPDANPQHVIAVRGSRVHETTDGGTSWTSISNGLESLDINSDMIFKLVQNPLDSQQLTIASTQGIFTSADAGQNWNQLSGTIVHNIKHSTENEGHIIAATHSSLGTGFHLIYSKDGGETWESVEDDLYMPLQSGNVYSSTDFHFDGDFADIYIGTAGLGVLKYQLDLTTMGISEPEIVGNTFVIYPNPASDVINIATKEKVKSVEIYSLNGQKIMHTHAAEINVSHLSKGVYILKIHLENGKVKTEKFIKK